MANATTETYTDQHGNPVTKEGDKFVDTQGNEVPADQVTTTLVDNSNKVATVGDIVNTINKTGFTLTTSASNGGEVSGTTKELVSPGDTVTIDAGKNIKVTQDADKITIETKDQVSFGEKGEPGQNGVDGSVGVNGKDGSAVVLNGKDGSIGLNGKDGKDGLTFKAADGAQGVDGKNGENGLPGKDGTTRIVYQPTNPDGTPKGEPEQVATLNDGLIFTGNNEDTLNRHKLNTVVKVVGEGVNKTTSENFKSAAGNINVKANGSDTLEVQMNKDLNLTPNGSVTIGDTVINNGTVSGLNDHLKAPVTATGNVTNATQTAPVNLSDNEKKQAATVGDVLNAGWNLKANGDAVDAVTHGDTVDFTSKNGTVIIKPETNGKVSTIDLAINTGDVSADNSTGKAVVGKDGKVDNSPNAGNKVATVGDVANTINNTGWTTTAKDKDGNVANVVVNPGDQVNYTNGTGTTANITVTTDPVTGKDIVNVSYDINTGNITKARDQDVKDAAGNVVIPAGKVSVQGTPIGNETQADADAREGSKVATVQNVADAINSVGWIVNTGKAEDQSSFTTKLDDKAKKVSAGDKVDFQAGKNMEVKQIIGNDGSVKIVYATSDNIALGEKGKDGKEGVDGSIGVNGKDGSAVVINGKDGSIGLNGKDGANGLTIKGEKGSVGVDGTDGKDGKDGMTRIVYTDDKGTKHEVATRDDGLKFTGNDTVNNHKLNSLVTVKGEGVDKAASKSFKSASGNINVKADGQGTLEVQLAKDLKGINSISNGNSSVTLNENGGTTIKGGDVNVDGNKITNVKAGTADTDAVNVSQLKQSFGDVNNRINKVSREARGGIAGANAAAGLPQVYLPGKSMLAASAGTFKGENAFAVGYSRASDNGKLILKLQGNANSQGDVGGSVGVGYQW
ncbi:YadA family autotransporter adhesin [Rodentibacter caecimuris]